MDITKRKCQDYQKKTIERVMKENGAKRITEEAKSFLAEYLFNNLKKITELSLRNASHLGRKTIIKADIEYALKNI